MNIVVELVVSASLKDSENDFETALKLYKPAFNNILEVNAQTLCAPTHIPGSSPLEIRTLADFINYKICSLSFMLNHPREAIAQFKRSIDTFKQHTREPEYAFEHASWLSQQYFLFAELFSNAIAKYNVKATKSQNPGYFYQEAGFQTIHKRNNVTEYTNDTIRYSNMPITTELFQMLINTSFPSFLKLCGWTCVDKYVTAQESSFNQFGPMSGMSIIGLLGKALENFKHWDKPRISSYLSVILADEYSSMNDKQKSNSLYKISLKLYHDERWTPLAKDIQNKLNYTQ